MNITRLKIVIVALVALAVTGTALAAHYSKVTAKRYNPDNRDVTVAAKKVEGAGNPSFADAKGWVLARSESGPNTSADLTIGRFGRAHGGTLVVTELGFDYLQGSYCGTTPRFNVETTGGGVYTFACGDGTQTDLGNGWTRVRFADGDVQVLGGPAWPGFGSANANFLQVLMDDGPHVAVLDAIDVNGTLIGS